MVGQRVGVLLAAGGAAWEVEAVRLLGGAAHELVLLKRCVDVPDLLATASTGEARVAVVSASLPGLDADGVSRLGRAGVAVLAVAEGPTAVGPPALPGIVDVVHADSVGSLLSAVAAAAGSSGDRPVGTVRVVTEGEPADAGGRVVAVWGPAGAPGRTTVAVGVAAELARRGHDTLLVDADPYGGAVAQHLGVLDEVSGLLSAVRHANAGRLDAAQLAAVAREVRPGLRVLTGLPRADRWVEVRPAAFDTLVERAQALCSRVVLDLGFSLEEEHHGYATGPYRNQMTVAGLERADEVVVVGSADPVGLARLARGLVELPGVAAVSSAHVVVNRMRASLGWGRREIQAMVEGFGTPSTVQFLPDDVAAADRALLAGRPLPETGDSLLARGLTVLTDALEGTADVSPGRRLRLRRRRAGRAL